MDEWVWEVWEDREGWEERRSDTLRTPHTPLSAGCFHTPEEKSLSPLQWTFAISPHFSRGRLRAKQID
ncbi:hypothetical protein [Chamaesiphon sp. VAR_48_metabat_403]|uniref:hypothetical protein n=1 Tax=Chamaesiphon sp. VAR_48_metabat_403 TaxID=2964700 RepID=UPI00286D72A7|nr:hypothetical protein [Chamaesiphon sp. VAR_48_metabat_403]